MSWRNWDYFRWNARLIEHCFGTSPNGDVDAIERIPATPDELVLVTQDASATPQDVVNALVTQVRRMVPKGQSTFCSFCNDFGDWSVAAAEPPRFFGMLWLTCLAAYGEPQGITTFAHRMWEMLGKKDNLQVTSGDQQPCCLPDLWFALRDWLHAQNAKGRPLRPLLLPRDLGHRTGIGHSWFLAFPHREDRKLLANVLWESGLVGFEPPVHRVLEVLDGARPHFGKGLLADLDDFKASLRTGAVAAADSAFWRAVRQEALAPSLGRDGRHRQVGTRVDLLVEQTQDGFRALVCGPADWSPPEPYSAHPFEQAVGRLEVFLRGPDGSLETPAESALTGGGLLGLAHQKLVDQGVLLLRQFSTEFFTVVSGSEAVGVRDALVRSDRLAAFTAAFGGAGQECLVPGWIAISGCRVQISEQLPAGLTDVMQLLPTMLPPSLTAAGGIRIPSGFLRVLHFLPQLHADGALAVVIQEEDGKTIACSQALIDGRTVWELPPEAVPKNGCVTARATFPPRQGTPLVAELELRFEHVVSQTSFKQLGAGTFGVEACVEAELALEGTAEVPLGVTTPNPNQSVDLFSLATQTRYLGPGIGQMSLVQEPGFDWLAVGPLNAPDLLIFVGNTDSPTDPAMAQSEGAGNRRHWRDAFSKAREVFVRLPDGGYKPVGEYPQIKAQLDRFRRHSVKAGAVRIPAMMLGSSDGPAREIEPARETEEAVEALAAISVRRSGMSNREVSEVLASLLRVGRTGAHDDHLSVQQLLRAWTECGQLDTTRNIATGRQRIAARRPRFVLVQRGPQVEGRIIGLLPSTLRSMVQHEAEERRLNVFSLFAPNPWQPSVLGVLGSLSQIESVAKAVGLEETNEWLHWPKSGEVADHLNVSNAYKKLDSTPPPPSYRAEFAWEWERRIFTREALKNKQKVGVVVERRLHADGSSVHVVLDDGNVVARSYMRNWALLFAYDLSGRRPFQSQPGGSLVCSGASPVHLPMPVARLAACVGAGLPGPQFDAKTGRVVAYTYPFGERLIELLRSVIPKTWVGHDLHQGELSAGSNR